MTRAAITALFLLAFGSAAAFGQQDPPSQPDARDAVSRYDVAGGFNYGRANAPPGGAERFNLYGGFVSSGIRISNHFSFAAEGMLGHANNIGPLGQNLTLFTLATGPRFTYTHHRFVPFAQILLGLSHGGDSYFPESTGSSTSATSYAIVAGGGLDYKLSRRLALRAINVEYLRTGFPNGTSNSQNHLLLGAGITIRFGTPEPPPSPPLVAVISRRNDLHFTCSTNAMTITQGQTLDVSGHAYTLPDQIALDFVWSIPGAGIAGDGRQITLDTAALTPGDYRVHGRATAIDDSSLTAECEAAFHVIPRVTTAAPAQPDVLADSKDGDRIFHTNVKDALFDYDSVVIRPDAQIAIEEAANYLQRHPEIQVQVQGYADERGSANYNLALGAERAQAARSALIARGVSAGRLEILSFGKGAQVCTEDSNACWQQNRRAAFSIKR